MGSMRFLDVSSRIAVGNAPTPGRINLSARATSAESPDTRTDAPSVSKAFETLRRFPIP